MKYVPYCMENVGAMGKWGIGVPSSSLIGQEALPKAVSSELISEGWTGIKCPAFKESYPGGKGFLVAQW